MYILSCTYNDVYRNRKDFALMKFLIQIRDELGLTNYAFAKRLGVNTTAVDRWEKMAREGIKPQKLSLSVIAKLPEVSGKSPKWILDRIREEIEE